MDLKEYEQRKFLLAEVIRSAQAIDTKNTALQGDCRELVARLAEDQFNLMMVGRFSRGKSTLMNAILGGDYLPTGIVPLTSVITTVRYGSRPQVVLHFRDFGLNHEIPLAQLADYVTQKGNPGNVKKIAWAEIQLPAEILRRGFFFVDTPGLGSPIIENTLTTERFLPQADAFILVTSYESPLSEEEDRILERIRNTGKKLFVVINKQDTVTAAEREQARQFVAEQLAARLGRAADPLHSISARQALEAKLSRNPHYLNESGIPGFETELLHFLTESRAQLFLVNMYERTMHLLTEWSRPDEHAWNALMERLRSQRESITGSGTPSEHVELTDSSADAWKLDIDRKTGCHICGVILEATFRFLSKYQYELTIDPERSRVISEAMASARFTPGNTKASLPRTVYVWHIPHWRTAHPHIWTKLWREGAMRKESASWSPRLSPVPHVRCALVQRGQRLRKLWLWRDRPRRAPRGFPPVAFRISRWLPKASDQANRHGNSWQPMLPCWNALRKTCSDTR